MLQFFRNFFSTKIGAIVGIAFVLLLGLLFLAGDIGGRFFGNGDADGASVATVGDRKISSSTLEQSMRTALDRFRQQDPRQTMATFLSAGSLAKVLDTLIDENALGEYGEEYGIAVGERLVGSEITRIPAFRGPDGNFSDAIYLETLQRLGMTDGRAREQISNDLIAQQIQVPASFGARVPGELVNRYVALLTETREGAIGLIPSAAFAAPGNPSDAELTKYYQANRDKYIRPERRVIRYVVFDDSVIKNVPAPTEAQIGAAYKANAAKYAPSETRKLAQLVLPTEAAAKAILAELEKGTTLEAAAFSKKLLVAPIPAATKIDYTAQNGAGAADAVFAAAKGQMVGPVKGSLGWYLVRVDSVDAKLGKTIDQARGEIVADLSARNKRLALTDFSAKMEEEFDNGASLADAAKELGLSIVSSAPLTADGKVYGKPTESAPADLAKVIGAAFAMEGEGKPQLAEIEPGKKLVMFDVTGITASAPAPFAEIKEALIVEYKLEKGSVAAKSAAEKLLGSVKSGTDLAAALATIGKPLPPVDTIKMNRAQLAAQGQNVPPPLALLFSMAKGTVKLLAAPRNRGWYVVSLKTATPGTPDPKSDMPAKVQAELSQELGREYSTQLRRAIREELGVKKNQSALDALTRRLLGN